jgi:hypothetical protein
MSDVSGEKSTGDTTNDLGATGVSAADAGDHGEPASLENFEDWFTERLKIRRGLVDAITAMP